MKNYWFTYKYSYINHYNIINIIIISSIGKIKYVSYVLEFIAVADKVVLFFHINCKYESNFTFTSSKFLILYVD